MSNYLFFLIIAIIFAIAFKFVLENRFSLDKAKAEKSPYEKKPFVFDVVSELNLYRLLIEMFSDKFYVFPQMSYGKLVQVRFGEEKFNRNKFDKKIADFVLCDKEKAIAKLVIELDGPSHQSKLERDNTVDQIMADIGLPILHLKTDNLDSEYIKQEVNKKLSI